MGIFRVGPAPVLALLQCAKIALLLRHQHVRQRVRLQEYRYDKEEHQGADHRAKHTQQDAQAPPSLPGRIIKNGFCHCWMCTNYRKRQAEAGQSGIALSRLSSCTTWECAF